MNSRRVIVVGGGAAGIFGAIICAEAAPEIEVLLLEKSSQLLTKVRISGGGRCNVTHACFQPKDLATHYPRGHQELISPFYRFQPRDCVAWFESRGVRLKTEQDERIFPVTDSSATIVDCLLQAAKRAGVKLFTNRGAIRVAKVPEGHFQLVTSDGEALECESLFLATGGCRVPALGGLATSLGHTLEPPVPSLFSFHIETPWLKELAGVSMESVEASVPSTSLRQEGALVVTHAGLSGPVVLKLSAWGARHFHAKDYRFTLQLNWLPHLNREAVAREILICREKNPARFVINTPLPPVSARLWERLVVAAGVQRTTRWASLSSADRHRVVEQLIRTELPVTGKSLNKDEFVTCGGVRLAEVDFRTMESKLCPHLYFAGELLDIDGLTGGFNFQAAWTTGWIAGRSMAGLKTVEDYRSPKPGGTSKT